MRKIVSALILFLSFIINGSAQQDLTLYELRAAPQSNGLNPSKIPLCKGYLLLPGLSGGYASINSEGFTYADAFQLNDNGSIDIKLNEAMNLNLDHTELVVLSACETGVGEIKSGEGVYGLQRSFIVAGAQNVIMTLFKVNDEVTQELMSDFYTQWLATGDKRAAFQSAKLKIKEKYQKPVYWGSFVLIGM
ncbi:CHAT domain-containing protein [Salibacteraceae bacterium]|nr:CHAT domain-containing protein [Salibacteraceae bacterium]MDB9724753.1 CHAT domain-containing protein [Salibacteraceae bacterium]